MTIKVGGNFIKIDASGVHVVGSAINFNSGGSAGSGSGFSGVAPEPPLGAASPEYNADLEAPEGNIAPDTPVSAMSAAAMTSVSDKTSTETKGDDEAVEEETPFEAGYLINDKTTTRQQLYYDHVSDKDVFHLAVLFNKNNMHLNPDKVLPGEMVILASKPKSNLVTADSLP